MGNRWGNSGNSGRLYFFGSKITVDGYCSHEIKRPLLLGKKVMTNLDTIFKSGDITLQTKVHLVKAMVFSSSHVLMWELDSEESWAWKNWCFWNVVLKKTLESPLDSKKMQPVHPKGDQSCVFIGRTNVEAETPKLWPPHAKSWFIRKDPNAGKDWEQEEKGTTEDKMAGWHTNSMDLGLGGLQELVINREAWRAAIHGVAKSRTGLNWATGLNWTELNAMYFAGYSCREKEGIRTSPKWVSNLI